MLSQFGPGPYFRGALSSSAVQPATYVLLAFGQSNMIDQSGNDNAVAWPANTQVLDTQTETYGPATNPLTWLETNPGVSSDWQDGPGQLVKHFAIDWCAAHPADTLIVVACARGGTGFPGEWIANGAGHLYNEALRLLDVVFNDYPEARFLAVLAQHGENDGKTNNRTYLWNAGEMIAKIRDRYGAPSLPVIWGEPGPKAQFTITDAPGYDAVRAQIRDLPNHYPHVATVRGANPAAFDALTDLDDLHFDAASQKVLGGLHHNALAAARASTAVTLPDAALIWQTTGEQGWPSYDVPCFDLQVGDTLILIAGAHRSSGQPFIYNGTINGQPLDMKIQQLVVQTNRLGLSAGSATLNSVPASGILPVSLNWGALPTGGSVQIWRVRGGAVLGAGTFGHNANRGTVSVVLTAGLPGAALIMGYAVHTGGAFSFSGDGTVLVEGPGNKNAVYFTSRVANVSGSTATLSLTPSVTPSNVCGMIAVAVG